MKKRLELINLERKGGAGGGSIVWGGVNGDTWLQRVATAREAAVGFSVETSGQIAAVAPPTPVTCDTMLLPSQLGNKLKDFHFFI